MHVATKLDEPNQIINKLKPLQSEHNLTDTKNFSDVLQLNLENGLNENRNSTTIAASVQKAEANNLIQQEFMPNSAKTRKPNMREFIEAITGKSVEELYSQPNDRWKSTLRNAEELLYGVVGSNEDKRDWSKIMSSSNILRAAKLETGKMYGPTIDIETHYNNTGTVINQTAVIKDKNSNTLRTISNDPTLAEETLINFGATSSSVPTKFEDEIIDGKFDIKLLSFLKNFAKKPVELNQVALHEAAEVISQRLSKEIPMEEYSKL